MKLESKKQNQEMSILNRIRLAAINTIKSSNRLKIESEGHRHLYLSSTSYSIEWKQTTFGSLEGSVGMSIMNF